MSRRKGIRWGLAWALVFAWATTAHARTPRAPDEVRPPFVGQVVPNVELVGPKGERESLYGRLANSPAVIVFFRGGSIPHASKELAQLGDVVNLIKEAGFEVIAVSPDAAPGLDPESRYQLYSDPDGEAAVRFGVGYAARAEDFKSPAEFAAWKAQRARPKAKQILAVPAVFVVDRKGIVLYAHVNVGFRVELSGEILLTAARAYGAPK